MMSRSKKCLAASSAFSRTRGSASVEYALVTSVVIIALFVPIDGAAGGQSAVGMLMDALRQFQSHTTYLLSLP